MVLDHLVVVVLVDLVMGDRVVDLEDLVLGVLVALVKIQVAQVVVLARTVQAVLVEAVQVALARIIQVALARTVQVALAQTVQVVLAQTVQVALVKAVQVDLAVSVLVQVGLVVVSLVVLEKTQISNLFGGEFGLFISESFHYIS